MGRTMFTSEAWHEACREHLFVVNVDGKHFEVYNESVTPYTIEATWEDGSPQLTCTCPDYQSGNICKHIHRLQMELGAETIPSDVYDVDPLLKRRVRDDVCIPHIEDVEERYDQAIIYSDEYDALQESSIQNITGAACDEDEDGFWVFDYEVGKEAWVRTKDPVELEDWVDGR